MKKVLFMMSLMISCIFSTNGFATSNEETLDQTVAVVNDDIITRSELSRAMYITKIQISQMNSPAPSDQALRKQVLERLINKKLQLQVAKQAGIIIKDAELNDAIQSVAQQNNMSVNTLYDRIRGEGMSVDDYKDEIRDQMTMQKLQQQEVISHISITPKEVDRFIQSKAWQNNESKQYKLNDILIPISDTPSSEEIAIAKKRAIDVIAKLNQGKSFKELAQTYSADKHALQGGDLGWRKIAEIPTAFAEQVVNMQPKDVAGPIQTPNGFHILNLVAVKDTGEKQASPDRRQIQSLLMQKKFEEAVQNWVSRLRGQAFIVESPIPA